MRNKSWFERHPKKTLFLVTLLSFLVIILSLEVGTRLFFKDINFLGVSHELFRYDVYGKTYANKQNAKAIAFGAMSYTDANGFRFDPKNDYRAKDKQPALVILGDSVVFGIGLEADQIYQARLDQKLEDYRVINTAVIGYSINEYEDVINYLILKRANDFKIRYVILGYTLNDLIDESSEQIRAKQKIAFNRFFFIFKQSDVMQSINDYFRERSKFYLLIKDYLIDSSKGYFLGTERTYHNEPFFDHQLAKIGSMAASLKSNNIEFLVVIFPYEYQLREQKEALLYPQLKLKRYFDEHHIKYVDPYNDFTSYMERMKVSSKSFYLFNDCCHFSTMGHKLIGEVLLKRLKAENIH